MDNRELYTTAELAKLNVSADDMVRLSAEIGQILEYFEKMMEIDVDGLEPTTHALLKQNRVREDTLRDDDKAVRIMENVPETEDNFITVPKIF